MNMFYYILGLILVLKAIPVNAGEYCSYRYSCYNYFSSSYTYCTKSTYCGYGCCGSSSYSSYSDICCTTNLTAIIAGAVIGGLVVIGLVIALIVYCCVYKSGYHRGTVIAPANTTEIRTVTVSGSVAAPVPSSYPGQYGPVMYSQTAGLQVPPPYTPFNSGTSGVTNAVYPPPPPPKY